MMTRIGFTMMNFASHGGTSNIKSGALRMIALKRLKSSFAICRATEPPMEWPKRIQPLPSSSKSFIIFARISVWGM